MLRRILKYTPAVVLGLLVVAWAISHHWRTGLSTDLSKGRELQAGIGAGSLFNTWARSDREPMFFFERRTRFDWPEDFVGEFGFDGLQRFYEVHKFPLPLLLTAVLLSPSAPSSPSAFGSGITSRTRR